MLDIARWRRRRRDELSALATRLRTELLESGGEREWQLTPMTP